MRLAKPHGWLFLGIGMALAAWPAGAQEVASQAIGLYTAVAGKVTAIHAGQPDAVAVSLRGDVFFKDVIETQAGARAKALLRDDSLLTLGEKSRLEISEHVYDPAENRRSAVLRLVKGTVRALVGKAFAGESRFEVHTPTAVAAARGTYFVVWIEGEPGAQLGMGEVGRIRPVLFQGMDVAQLPAGTTGVANIGNTGGVDFTSGGQTVNVGPGTFSTAPPGGPPIPPVNITANPPAGVIGAIKGTEQSDAPKQESPGQTAASIGGGPGTGPGVGGLIVPPPVFPSPPGGSTPPSPLSGSSGSTTSGTPGGNTFNPPPPMPPPRIIQEGG
jgi:hypothetical protein